jgi:hypothetical protein
MSQYPPYQPQPVYIHAPPQKGASGFGVAALVLGLVALVIGCVPVCGVASIPLAIVGLVLAVAGFIVSVTGGRSTVGMSVAGGVVCLLSIVSSLFVAGAVLTMIGLGGESIRRAAEEEAKRAATRPATTQATTAPTAAPSRLSPPTRPSR